MLTILAAVQQAGVLRSPQAFSATKHYEVHSLLGIGRYVFRRRQFRRGIDQDGNMGRLRKWLHIRLTRPFLRERPAGHDNVPKCLSATRK